MEIVSCDVLVVGSGAGGLAAAITAQHFGCQVIVIEKEAVFGGTTARSGGWLWVPGNPLAAREGAVDSIPAARTYIQHAAGNHFDGKRVDAFLASAGNMVSFFETHTEIKFAFGKNYPDYHPDHPGGAEEGRSIHALPFDGRQLGRHLASLAQPMAESTFMGMGLNSGPDLKHFLNATRSVRSALFVASRIAGHGRDVLLHGRGTRLVNGNALAARLLKTVLDRKIAIWSSAKAVSLDKASDRVVGAVVDKGEGQRVLVKARLGVVLAAGGFPADNDLRKRHFRHVREGANHVTLAAGGSTGDALRMAGAVGAGINDAYANAAAWVPVSLLPRSDGSVGRFFHLIDRAKPGVIAVTADGRRFTNESHNYHDFVGAMIDACAGKAEVSAFLICDHRTLRRYGLGAVRPSPLPISGFIRSGYLKCGRTLRDLATSIGLDPDALSRTVEAVNRDAAQGLDREFERGATAYQRLLGDSDFAPNPCVGEISRAPYYAVKIIPGDIGTYHGLVTDEHARVVGGDGQAVEGLFAVGNDAASIFGGSYPGAGATLGPAMTFGYICGTFLAAKNRDQPRTPA